MFSLINLQKALYLILPCSTFTIMDKMKTQKLHWNIRKNLQKIFHLSCSAKQNPELAICQTETREKYKKQAGLSKINLKKFYDNTLIIQTKGGGNASKTWTREQSKTEWLPSPTNQIYEWYTCEVCIWLL